YRRFLAANPATTDHASAFPVFAAVHTQQNPPKNIAPSTAWDDKPCTSIYRRIFRAVPPLVAAAAIAVAIPGHKIVQTVAPATPLKPRDYAPEPARQLPPREEAGLKAARDLGGKFASEPPRD